jgi:hypothetical protein
MKCLSLWQPWASLIIIGAKRFETRSWETLYRGPLLIHAAKHFGRAEEELCLHEPYLSTLEAGGFFREIRKNDWQMVAKFGCILGVADLVECWLCGNFRLRNAGGVQFPNAIAQTESEFGDFSPGRFAWQLENVLRFPTPIPFNGHQGIFNVDDDLVADQIAQAAIISPESVQSVKSVDQPGVAP